jgi:hypothetical protein
MQNSYNIPIGLIARLGLIITRCAWIDEILGHILTKFLGANRGPMYVITQNVSASTITDWLRTLAPLHLETEDLRTEFATLLVNADEVRAERNALAHGLWREGPEPMTALVQTIRLNRAEIIREELHTESDLDDLVQRCTETLSEALAFRKKIGIE